MTISQRREVAAALIIDTRGRFLLQQRDDIPGILFPGKIGLFGGHREGEETFLECAVREVHEEISYFISPERFEHLASFRGPDPHIVGGTLWRELYVVRDVPVEPLRVTEGTLFVAEMKDVPALVPRLAPSAHDAIRLYLTGAVGLTATDRA
jgi:8-oxo-dGTP diphosphatase